MKRGDFLNLFHDLDWQGDSQKMVAEILNAVPSFFRTSVRRSIEDWVIRHQIKVVTEPLVFEAVRDIAPPKLARQILPALERMKTQ